MGNFTKVKSGPCKINFLYNLANDSYSAIFPVYIFDTFRGINNILYLIYTNINMSIILYDIIHNQKISEIKKAHCNYITCFRHYTDKNNQKDYIMSISWEDNNLKIWNLSNLECLLNLKNINFYTKNVSACFLSDKEQIYIATCNGISRDYYNKDYIKIFDLKGNIKKIINNSNLYDTVFIDNFYDNELSNNYIMTSNITFSISYDYNHNKIHHTYRDKENVDKQYNRMVVYKDEDLTKLIESCGDGFIRIWNFHLGTLLKKINCKQPLNCICLWDNKYAFVGCSNKTIKLVDLNNEKTIKNLEGHNNRVLFIQIINHSKYGECLVSQGFENDQIKLWLIKN